MEMIQTEVVPCTTHMTTWLPRDKRVKPGSILSLDKEDGLWTVAKQYSSIELCAINRGWNNNI